MPALLRSKIGLIQETMSPFFSSFAELSNDQLLAAVHRLAATERRATAELIRLLMELDTRRLYLDEGYSSLFAYCTQVLHLAEGAAYNRIEAARAARRFPMLLDGLDDGSLTLTSVRLLAPQLTVDNCAAVVETARYKSKVDIERLVASLAPKKDLPALVRKLPAVALSKRSPSGRPQLHAGPASITAPLNSDVSTSAMSQSSDSEPLLMPARSTTAAATVAPLAPARYKVQLTISGKTYETLQRVQALMRHTFPDADLAAIVDRALTLLLDDLERRRCAAVATPRESPRSTKRSRHIPAAVRREVWRRDEGRCAFVGRHGQRCTERGFLEFHHVHPYADGGAASVANIQLRCRAHNAHEAWLLFEQPGRARETRPAYGFGLSSRMTPPWEGNSLVIREEGEQTRVLGVFHRECVGITIRGE